MDTTILLGLWCKFGCESFKCGINSLEIDAEVVRIIQRVEAANLKELHIYFEHLVDDADVIQDIPSLLKVEGEARAEVE